MASMFAESESDYSTSAGPSESKRASKSKLRTSMTRLTRVILQPLKKLPRMI